MKASVEGGYLATNNGSSYHVETRTPEPTLAFAVRTVAVVWKTALGFCCGYRALEQHNNHCAKGPRYEEPYFKSLSIELEMIKS